MTALLPPALLLCASLLLLILVLTDPASRIVRRRVDVLARIASQQPEERGAGPSLRRLAGESRRFFTLGMGFDWGVKAGALTLLLIGIICANVVWLIMAPLLGLPALLALAVSALAFWYVPHRFARREQNRAEGAFLAQFADAVDMMVRMLRAGMPISVAIRTVARESAAPVNEVFTPLADQIQIGVPLEEALGRSSERIGIQDYRFFAAAIDLQTSTGGNLVTTLETLVEIIRKRQTVRLEARAATAEERVSAYVIGVMPFLVLGGLLIFSPGYLAPLVTDRRGNFIVVLAAAMLLAGFLSMQRLMRSAARL